MIKRSTRYYLLQGIIVSAIALMCFLGYFVTKTFTVSEPTENISYVSYEVLTDNVMPVLNETPQEDTDIIRPYTNTEVTVGKSYYDYQGENDNQEKSIVYYENTYIQNQGTDYVLKDEFDVNSIADGEVISITKDDITGSTIKIKHNNLISVYQSVNNIKVKEKESVVKGQVIATSGTNNIGSDLGNHLHFELYKDNILINPEEYFNQGN